MHSFLKKFIKAENGSIAPIFAGAIMPVIFITGASVDYSTQIKNNSYVSNVADAALLSVTDDVSELVKTVKNKNKLKTKVTALLDPLLTAGLTQHKDLTYTIDNVAYDKNSQELRVDIELEQDTTFIKLANVDKIKSTVSTALTMGDEVIKKAASVAFVVDKSGSMMSDWKHIKTSLKALKTKFGKLDPKNKYVRVGYVVYDSTSKGFFGMDWGMQKTWKDFKKVKNEPRAGDGTNSSGAILEAYDKLRTQAENNAHAKKGSSNVRKVVVFFSDGINDKQAQTDATSQTCTDIKAAGIEIYSILFGYTQNATAANMMTNCATDADHYFRSKNKAQLLTAFDEIGQTITQRDLYLSY